MQIEMWTHIWKCLPAFFSMVAKKRERAKKHSKIVGVKVVGKRKWELILRVCVWKVLSAESRGHFSQQQNFYGLFTNFRTSISQQLFAIKTRAWLHTLRYNQWRAFISARISFSPHCSGWVSNLISRIRTIMKCQHFSLSDCVNAKLVVKCHIVQSDILRFVG